MPTTDDEITLGELSRNLRDMREDYERGLREARQDTQHALNTMQRSVDKLVDSVERLPYVRQDIFEERISSLTTQFEDRMKHAGERLGKSEQEVQGIKGTLSKINFTAWTGIVFPFVMTLMTAAILAVVNLR